MDFGAAYSQKCHVISVWSVCIADSVKVCVCVVYIISIRCVRAETHSFVWVQHPYRLVSYIPFHVERLSEFKWISLFIFILNCTKFPITLNQNWHGEFYSGIPCTQANKHISEIFSLDTEHAHVCLCLTKIYGSCSGNRFRKVISADNHWVINLGMSNKSSDRQAGPDTRTQVKFCLTLKPIIKNLAYILHFF